MRSFRSPGLSAGILAAAFLTICLIAVLYAAWKVAGLPFVPYEVFDWQARVLPGSVIEFGIGTMVTIIRALKLGPTSTTAKVGEQTMAILGFLFAGVVAGAILFLLVRSRHGRGAVAQGVVLGAIAAVASILVNRVLAAPSSSSPAAGAAWILAAFLAWGGGLGRVHRRLVAPRASDPDAEIGLAELASVERTDRRSFLIRLGGATAAITVAGAVVGKLVGREHAAPVIVGAGGPAEPWSASNALPNADDPVVPAPGTRPEFTPLSRHYRIDINTVPPSVDLAKWKLEVRGLVESPFSLTLEDLSRYEQVHQFVTLSCISNPVGGDLIGTTRWSGVSLQKLLPGFKPKPQATHMKIRCTDGFYEIVPLGTVRADDRVMLVHSWDGLPLAREHGAPLRIYIPDLHGMKQPKWIESIEFTDRWEPGYWVERGWDKTARMKATSVIDTVAVDMTIINADRRSLVPVGGIAHAGARGISKVEVRVDDGPWQAAKIRAPLSALTWVLWRYDWPFEPGKHTFTVRCVDGLGAAQIEERAPVAPSGASGLFRKTEMF